VGSKELNMALLAPKCRLETDRKICATFPKMTIF